jgi:hypothetical protein
VGVGRHFDLRERAFAVLVEAAGGGRTGERVGQPAPRGIEAALAEDVGDAPVDLYELSRQAE